MTTRVVRGRADTEGTSRYAGRFAGRLSPDHFRRVAGLMISSLGAGTYLGEPDAVDDAAYRESVAAAVRAGSNVIDTAVNYRFQRSERCLRHSIAALLAEGFRREEIVVATKGGFLAFEGEFPADPLAWFRKALLEPGIATPDDVVANCHVMTPAYLAAQIEWSRSNLGLETIDIYYVHNPETQLREIDRSEFIMRIRASFEMLEEKAAAGVIGVYGVATWDGFRVPPGHPEHLSLQELLLAAEHAGGAGHHFRALQAPLNLVMGEACLSPTQLWKGRRASLLEAAAEAGLVVMSSGSLLQGQVIGALPESFGDLVPDTTTNAQRGLQVVRSAPGLATALVGMKRIEHVEENLRLAAIPRLPPGRAVEILRACASR